MCLLYLACADGRCLFYLAYTKLLVHKSVFFKETFTIWRVQMEQACFLCRVHMGYMCLSCLACTHGRYVMGGDE